MAISPRAREFGNGIHVEKKASDDAYDDQQAEGNEDEEQNSADSEVNKCKGKDQ